MMEWFDRLFWVPILAIVLLSGEAFFTETHVLKDVCGGICCAGVILLCLAGSRKGSSHLLNVLFGIGGWLALAVATSFCIWTFFSGTTLGVVCAILFTTPVGILLIGAVVDWLENWDAERTTGTCP